MFTSTGSALRGSAADSETGSTSRDLITDDRVEYPRNLGTGTKGPADSKSVSDHFKWVFCLCYVRREVFKALGADALLLG